LEKRLNEVSAAVSSYQQSFFSSGCPRARTPLRSRDYIYERNIDIYNYFGLSLLGVHYQSSPYHETDNCHFSV